MKLIRVTTLKLLVAVGLIVGTVQTTNAATWVHDYQLDGDYLDSFGGPPLVPNGGALGASRYDFGINQGLSLENGLVDTSDYSIVMVFEYDALSPLWKKVIDFEELTLDFGLYIADDNLAYWTLASGGGPGMIAANTDVHMVLTRENATQTVRGYLNGVLQWTNTDPTGQSVASTNVLTFFEDDIQTGFGEAQSGSVDCIEIHDGALSDAEVADMASRPGCGSATVLSCVGFDAPMANYPVKAKKNRVFPLKMELFDGDWLEQTDTELIAAPVIQVIYDPDAAEQDVTEDAFPAGNGTVGNQFEYTGGANWQFNLKSSNYTASGTYMVTVESGDDSEYVIAPSCVTSFVIK